VQENAAPYRIETGTLNHAAIEGVGAAVDYLARFGRGKSRREAVHAAVAAIATYEHSLGQLLWSELEKLPGVRLWGLPFTQADRAPTVHSLWKGMIPLRWLASSAPSEFVSGTETSMPHDRLRC